MINLTEEYIKSLAYNDSSFTNAKKIVNKNQLSKTYITDDKSIIYGECSGSGKENYKVSVDFINPNLPVFRCTCPSRQIPCKHSIALLYQYYLNSNIFLNGDIPDDILAKRSKIEKREEKKKEEKVNPKKVDVAAFVKKMKVQLKGLELVDRFIDECFTIGFASIPLSQIKSYEDDLIKELGNYYLPEHIARINNILDSLKCAKTCDNSKYCANFYNNATNEISALYNLNKKSRSALRKYIDEKKIIDEDAAYIFTKIGYTWKLEELKNLGFYKEDGKLLQLGFFSYSDNIRKSYFDVGFMINLNDNTIYESINIRPFKLKDRLKADDTLNELIITPEFYIYPSDLNPRIRWEGATMREITKNDINSVRTLAKDDFKSVIKEVKTQLKNVLSNKYPVCLLKYKELVKLGDNMAIIDKDNEIILLDDLNNYPNFDFPIPGTVLNLNFLLNKETLKNSVILGVFNHDLNTNRLIMQPISLITKDNIIKLLG